MNKRLLILYLLLLLILAGCNLPREQQPAQPSEKLTEVYATLQARLTEEAGRTPAASATPQPTLNTPPTSTNTQPPSPTVANLPPTPIPPSPTSSTPCDLAGAGNPIDVTIPDDTVIQPGQAFTKIWRLQNLGACTWNRNYAVTYFSGEQMSAPASVPLAGEVRPGQSVDIAVDMVAPNKAGKYQGNWKLRSAANALFGIGPNGGAPFWVRIVVPQTPTPTTTQPTPTATITLTPPPPVKISGASSLVLDTSLDLDTNQVISGVGGDMAYVLNESSQHALAPQGSALLAVFGANQPTLNNCQATAIGSAPVIIESLTAGTYFCYRTDQNSPGRLLVSSINAENFTLSLEILTWAVP